MPVYLQVHFLRQTQARKHKHAFSKACALTLFLESTRAPAASRAATTGAFSLLVAVCRGVLLSCSME
jgi:hypothetical protein